MSVRELLDLPVTFPLEPANRALGLGRSDAYAMAKAGTYPLPLLRLGRRYRVKRSDLLRLLNITDPEAPTRAEPARPSLVAFKPEGFKAKPFPPLRAVN
jgi:hypothetical protein